MESNQFGTDEFIDFCREVGAVPSITVNVGSGTPQEAAEWVEYCNGGLNTTYGKFRAEYGHPETYNVKYWGLGNELFGEWEIGHMNAEQYAQKVIEFAGVMKSVDPSIKLIAVGWFGTSGDAAAWNRKVVEVAGDYIDYLSLHAYCWKPSYEAYSTIMNWPLDIERDLKMIVRMIKTVKPDKDIKIAFDEWNVWYANATSGLMQSVRLCDGLMAAGMFHVFHRLCNDVTMANFAQLVNALPAIVTNDNGEICLTPVYLAFKLYRDNAGVISLKTSITGVSSRILDVSATMDEEGDYLYLSVVNKDLDRKVNATISLNGFKPKQVCKLSQLNGPSIDSKNDFNSLDTVKITVRYVNLSINSDGLFTYVFEPHSATILALESITSTATPIPEIETPDTETAASDKVSVSQQMLIVLGVLIILVLIIVVLKRSRKLM